MTYILITSSTAKTAAVSWSKN